MATTYKIHPGIGIARLGNSETDFYLAPENPGARPQECDEWGNPRHEADGQTPRLVTQFKDSNGKIKRQAARFQVFVYDDKSPEGRPLRIGDDISGGGNHGTLVDIQWRVYLANKKSGWYEFRQLRGEHGYGSGHARRNAHVTGAERQRLNIDPGPRIVNATDTRRAAFDRRGAGEYATNFPPESLKPHRIDTLGDLVCDNAGRLLVLGGHGNAGSELAGPGQPRAEDYANNDGWYDDISDGPVMARLVMYSKQVSRHRFIDVEYPAWVVVGYPRYAPEILDIVTMDEVLYDMSLKEFAADTRIYGRLGSFDHPERVDVADPESLRHWKAGRLTWNDKEPVCFYRDVWPILFRPNEFNYLCNILAQSNFPHSQVTRGTFHVDHLSVPPKWIHKSELEKKKKEEDAAPRSSAHLGDFAALQAPPRQETKGEEVLWDPYYAMRQFLFQLLRLPGEENAFRETGKVKSRFHNLPLMPLLCGDNPLSNYVPSKFLCMTDHQLFLLRQWADGKFVNEIDEGWLDKDKYNPYQPYPRKAPASGRELDRGVLSNVLGGAFCPGGEVGWVMRNPSIYLEPYRIKADRRFSSFRQTAAQANAQSGDLPPQDYTSYLDFELGDENDFSRGLQPGDLTKHMAVPWQADFNQCTLQPINITYEDWNRINPAGDGDERLAAEEQTWETLWWPAHRPLQAAELLNERTGSARMVNWSQGIPQTDVGNLKMVSDWWKLGFVLRNPFVEAEMLDRPDPQAWRYVIRERG